MLESSKAAYLSEEVEGDVPSSRRGEGWLLSPGTWQCFKCQGTSA